MQLSISPPKGASEGCIKSCASGNVYASIFCVWPECIRLKQFVPRMSKKWPSETANGRVSRRRGRDKQIQRGQDDGTEESYNKGKAYSLWWRRWRQTWITVATHRGRDAAHLVLAKNWEKKNQIATEPLLRGPEDWKHLPSLTPTPNLWGRKSAPASGNNVWNDVSLLKRCRISTHPYF